MKNFLPTPHPPRRLRRFVPRAFGARFSAPSALALGAYGAFSAPMAPRPPHCFFDRSNTDFFLYYARGREGRTTLTRKQILDTASSKYKPWITYCYSVSGRDPLSVRMMGQLSMVLLCKWSYRCNDIACHRFRSQTCNENQAYR